MASLLIRRLGCLPWPADGALTAHGNEPARMLSKLNLVESRMKLELQ